MPAQGGVCPGDLSRRGVYAQGGVCLAGVFLRAGVWCLPRGVFAQGGCLPRGCMPNGCLPRCRCLSRGWVWGCLPRDVCPMGAVCSLPRGGVCPGGCLGGYALGVSTKGVVCCQGVCLPSRSRGCLPDTHLWTEWQTGVKTLPCRNYVEDGNDGGTLWSAI